MQLPSVADVTTLTGTSLSEVVVTSLIQDAALVAEDCIAGYAPARQTAIIKWLAAHLVASTSSGGESTLTSDKLGDAAQTFARATTGDALSGTMYGQQALALDTNGCLTRKGRARASIQVL
jgi:hypothetical protein